MRCALLMLGLALPALAETPEGSGFPSVPEVQIFGESRFLVPAPPLALIVRPDDGVCSVDAGGMTCFDTEGVPEWDLDLPGYQVFDVVAGDTHVALIGEPSSLIMPLAGGQAELLSPEVVVVPRADGELIVIGEEVGFPLPEGYHLTEALAALDGRIGLFDAAGDLLWLDAEGEILGVQELGLSIKGGLRALPVDEGWAILDDEGLLLIDARGEPVGALDLGIVDIATFEGGVMAADGERVWRVSAAKGEVQAIEVEIEAWRVGVSRDGERLAVAGAGEGSLHVWQGVRKLGGVGHRAAVVSVVPGPRGGAISIDADGVAIHWRTDGSGEPLGDQVLSAAFDGQGGVWLARLARLDWLRDGGGRSWEVEADDLLGVVDGVVLRSGEVLERWTVEGDLRWSTVAPAGSLAAHEGVLTVAAGEELWVLDLDSGQRRRRIWLDQGGATAAGVSTGGLVALGWWGAVPVVGRPPELQTVRALGAMSVGPALAPGGRWAVWGSAGDRFILSDLEGGIVLADGTSEEMYSLAVDDEHAWFGLRDGRVERWRVGHLAQDTPLVPFEAYAQLEVFRPFPEPTPPRASSSFGPIHGLFVTDVGELGMAVGGLAFRSSSGSVRVGLVEQGRPRVARWSAAHGVVAGFSDGRLFGRSQAGSPELLAELSSAVVDLCGHGSKLYVGTHDGLWLVEPGLAPRRAYGAPSGLIEELACDPEGRWGAARSEGEVRIWNLRTGQGLATLRQGGAITSLALSPSGEVVTGGADEVVVGWETARWTPVWMLEGHEAPVVAVAVDGSGQSLIAAADERAVVWDLDRGEVLKVVDLGDRATSAVWLPSGRFVVGGLAGRLVEIDGGGEQGRPSEPITTEPPAGLEDLPLAVPMGGFPEPQPPDSEPTEPGPEAPVDAP